MSKPVHSSRGKPRAPIKADISAARARSLLSYDPETGVLRWTVSYHRAHEGAIAGCVSRTGYVMVGIHGKLYCAHRVIWLIVHGQWPRQMIDHINGRRADNRLCNLREATPSLNGLNRGLLRNNTTGYPGVQKSGSRWSAFIWRNDRQYSLGTHESPQHAYAVVLAVTKLLVDEETNRFNQPERQLSA